MAGYVFNGMCLTADSFPNAADIVNQELMNLGFWPPNDSVILNSIPTDAGDTYSSYSVTTTTGTYSFYSYPCDQYGPWPDPNRLTPYQAAGLAVFTLVLVGAAFSVRAVRRAR